MLQVGCRYPRLPGRLAHVLFARHVYAPNRMPAACTTSASGRSVPDGNCAYTLPFGWRPPA